MEHAPLLPAALEAEDTWTSIGPLVAVMSVAVVVFMLAGLLTLG